MKARGLLLAAAALLLTAQAPAPTSPAIIADPGGVIATAPDGDWREIETENLIVFETARGRMVLELAPDFAPAHIAAVRSFVAQGRFDGGAITRVQDNYVVQWAARPAEVAAPADPLPAEYERPAQGLIFTPLGFTDPYAEAGFINSWPAARDLKAKTVWLAHCYGMVGVGRDGPPDVGDGTELYAVIGHAPRHLDRNLAVIGRIVEGLDAHSSLPRGTDPLGVYATPAERTPITRAMLAANLPEPPRFQVMDTASASFVRYKAARANRTGFFVKPAQGLDLCNTQIPVRRLAPGRQSLR
jgi:peptidylprolyl isomerase